MSRSTELGTNIVSQDMYPGAWIEPKWSRYDELKNCAFYAMRICLGAKITECPRGHQKFVSLHFEGTEFVMHRDNFDAAMELSKVFESSYLKTKGYTEVNRHMPEIIIDGIRFLEDQIEWSLDVPKDKVKMIWIRPDIGPCGYYRSYLPSKYMKENFGHLFYCENQDFLNLASLNWFETTVMHRIPPVQLLSVFQNLKNSGKMMIYEFDDDLFNVPEWNLNSKGVSQDDMDRARACISMAEMVVASTDPLKEVSDRPDIAMTGPNLIDMDQIGPKLSCDRKLNPRQVRYKPVYKNKDVEFHGPGKKLTKDEVTSDYNPVRVLWTGSNTHDKDLEVITSVVTRLVAKYGIAVRFFFFGYCPPQFLTSRVSSGNAEHSFAVRDEFEHAISYVKPVSMNHYYAKIREIDPDLAVCPLNNHIFNISKSNLKVLEMGAFGIPTIASGFGPYRFLEKEFDCGILVTENDSVAAWQNSIEYLISDIESRASISENSRKMVTEKWSWNQDSENRRKWDAIFNTIYRKCMKAKGVENEGIQAEAAVH